MNEFISVWARELRLPQNLKKVSGKNPGWYRWWAPETVLELFLNSQHITKGKEHMKKIRPYLWQCDFGQDSFFCVYVGVAIKESIRARLNWHVNQHHTKSAIQNGVLSTFRNSVASLIAGDQYNEVATNEVIDQLMIEYCAIDHPIKSARAKNLLEQIEHDELAQYVLPLNIRGNHQAILKSYLPDLKKARKLSK